MKTQIIRPSDSNAIRVLTLGEHTVADERLIFNGGPKDYRDKLFALYAPLGNFCHCIAILWSEGEHTVWDDACDEYLIDSLMVEVSEVTEENEEDFCRLGNASEPFDLTDCKSVEIPASVWQADWQFVYALGRCAGGENIKTGADI